MFVSIENHHRPQRKVSFYYESSQTTEAAAGSFNKNNVKYFCLIFSSIFYKSYALFDLFDLWIIFLAQEFRKSLRSSIKSSSAKTPQLTLSDLVLGVVQLRPLNGPCQI